MAALDGERADGPEVMGGFAFHRYSENNPAKATMFARWEVRVTEITGASVAAPAPAPAPALRRGELLSP